MMMTKMKKRKKKTVGVVKWFSKTASLQWWKHCPSRSATFLLNKLFKNSFAFCDNCVILKTVSSVFQAPEAISQVQQFVCELRRITLLWDELWLGTLTQNQGEINQRVSQLNAEISRVEQNASLSTNDREKLITEKYRIIVKPVCIV